MYQFDEEIAPLAGRFPAPDLRDPAAARAPRPAAAVSVPAGVTVEDHQVPVDGRATPLLVRAYRPAASAAHVGCIVQLHAGGFVVGSIEQEHQRNLDRCATLGAVVVAVEYRLAPEHRYPAALEDCCAALAWTTDNAAPLGVDARRVVLHGRSAGAGLAAATALHTRDHGGPPVRLLFLSAPQLDDRMTSASMRQFVDTPLWTRRAAKLSWQHYLGPTLVGSAEVPAYAAPARATNLAGLPPTYLGAMEFDPLRDEAIAFGAALFAAGVPTELHVFPGTFHCSSSLIDAAISRRERDEEIAVLRRHLSDFGSGNAGPGLTRGE